MGPAPAPPALPSATILQAHKQPELKRRELRKPLQNTGKSAAARGTNKVVQVKGSFPPHHSPLRTENGQTDGQMQRGGHCLLAPARSIQRAPPPAHPEPQSLISAVSRVRQLPGEGRGQSSG